MEPGSQLQLRDIHLPDAISWWSPAPGWWALLGLFFLIVICVRFVIEVKRRRRVRVAAWKAFEKLSAEFSEVQDKHWLVREISVLLRRICLSYFPRVDVASLTGEKWLHFLDKGLGEGTWHGRFSEGTGRALITAPYEKEARVDAADLLKLCGDWIKALPPLRPHSLRH